MHAAIFLLYLRLGWLLCAQAKYRAPENKRQTPGHQKPDKIIHHRGPEGKIAPLSVRLKRLAAFEEELDELTKGRLGKVTVAHDTDIQAIVKEAEGLIQKHGEIMQYDHLRYQLMGIDSGPWTTLSFRSQSGDMCDDSSAGMNGKYVPTPLWDEAPVIRKLLQPIEPALKRVRLSIMNPDTLVDWHCDDCPHHRKMAPPGCKKHMDDPELLQNHKFHTWVRLHLMLSSTDIDAAFGGSKDSKTTSGNFFLANVAMPHRVSNRGNSRRVALLVDVTIDGKKKTLQRSPLGRAILKAHGTVASPSDASQTYLKMGQAMYRYRCGDKCVEHSGDACLNVAERYETEWHAQMWSKPLWRPLPPFTPEMFNTQDRCGVLGDPNNKQTLLQTAMLLESGKVARDNRRRRRRRSTSADA